MSSHREVNREKQRKAIQNNEEFKLLQEQKAKRIEEEQHQRQMVKFFYYKWRKSGIHCIFNDFSIVGVLSLDTEMLMGRSGHAVNSVELDPVYTLFRLSIWNTLWCWLNWIVSKFLYPSVAFEPNTLASLRPRIE